METGLLAALIFAAVILVLAVVLTRLTRGRDRKDQPHDRTAEAVAKSVALNRLRDDGQE